MEGVEHIVKVQQTRIACVSDVEYEKREVKFGSLKMNNNISSGED